MEVYEIVKTIGSGTFGQVYMARHKREGKHYVIKRIKTRDLNQKDLENTENEVSNFNLKNLNFRSGSYRKLGTQTLLLIRTPSLTESSSSILS